MGGPTLMANLLVLGVLLYQHFAGGGIPWWLAGGYGIFVLFLGYRARRLKRRAADLLCVAARHAGLTRVTGKPAS
jgi:hypothetical protein